MAQEKDPILDGDCAQFAGANANKRERLRCRRVFDDCEAVCLSTGLPEPLDRRVQETLPGMRPDRIAEQRRIGALFEPILASVLPVGPSDRQIVQMRDGIVDDSTIAHGRTDNSIAVAKQFGDDPLQIIRLDYKFGVPHIRHIPFRRILRGLLGPCDPIQDPADSRGGRDEEPARAPVDPLDERRAESAE